MEYRLDEIFDLQMGKTPSRNNPDYWKSGDNKWISIADLSKCGKYITDTKEYLSDKAIEESGISQIPANTVIMSFKLTIGKTAITPEPMFSNEAIMSFRDRHVVEFLPEYIYYMFLSKDWDTGTNKAVMGKTLNKTTLSAIKVKIHSYSAQKKIVKRLDKVSSIIADRRQELEKLDDLIKARFVEMFGDLKSNSKGWRIVGFKDCADIDTNMIHDFENYQDYPHIGIDSIQKGTGRLVGYKTIAEDGVISGKYLFTPKHLIYSKIRPNLNKVALPDFEGLCSADAYPILVKDRVCNREYLAYTMRSDYFLEYILAFSNRTNLPKVNKNQVEGFTLPLPPFEKQEEFKIFIKQVDKSRVAVKKALDETQLLFDSLMQKYFG